MLKGLIASGWAIQRPACRVPMGIYREETAFSHPRASLSWAHKDPSPLFHRAPRNGESLSPLPTSCHRHSLAVKVEFMMQISMSTSSHQKGVAFPPRSIWPPVIYTLSLSFAQDVVVHSDIKAGSWNRFENEKLAVFGRCPVYHRGTCRGIHIRLKRKKARNFSDSTCAHTRVHAPPPNLDHQLMGIGERRQGAKREAEREVRRGQGPCPLQMKESIQGLRPQREEGRQGCLGENKSPSGEEKWVAVVQVRLRDGPGVVLTMPPPSPGSAWLRNSCCIPTLGKGPENCQLPNYRHFSLVSQRLQWGSALAPHCVMQGMLAALQNCSFS